jgi:hypothetical protein
MPGRGSFGWSTQLLFIPLCEKFAGKKIAGKINYVNTV